MNKKYELMLMRRMTAISTKMHTLNVHRSLKSQKKFTKSCYFSISRLFKVIDAGTPGKVVSSACYNKQ